MRWLYVNKLNKYHICNKHIVFKWIKLMWLYVICKINKINIISYNRYVL